MPLVRRKKQLKQIIPPKLSLYQRTRQHLKSNWKKYGVGAGAALTGALILRNRNINQEQKTNVRHAKKIKERQNKKDQVIMNNAIEQQQQREEEEKKIRREQNEIRLIGEGSRQQMERSRIAKEAVARAEKMFGGVDSHPLSNQFGRTRKTRKSKKVSLKSLKKDLKKLKRS